MIPKRDAVVLFKAREGLFSSKKGRCQEVLLSDIHGMHDYVLCASVTSEHFFQGECKPDVAASGPRVFKEELLVLAARIRIQLAFQLLHQYLMTPSHPRLPKLTPTPHFHVAAQRLQRVSADVMMSESDRAFIQRCLQDCLWRVCNKLWYFCYGRKVLQVILHRAGQ